MEINPEILLSIAIPTYNRAAYLDQNLRQIQKQWGDTRGLAELIVSNNCSPDNTEEIVNKYIKEGLPIRYNKNPENIGTRNIEVAFRLARGKYVLVFADDEVFLDGALRMIVDSIKDKDFGVVYLTGYGYENNWSPPKKKQIFRLHIYRHLMPFVKRIGYFFTFLSGNLVNRSLVDPDDIPLFSKESNVSQLGWVLSALFKSKTNAIIEGKIMACKGEPGGGYPLAQVFGVNANQTFKHFMDKGIDPKYFHIINRRMAAEFFPGWIFQIRIGKKTFQPEDYHQVLYPWYKSYFEYWLLTYPIISWPLPLARIWFKLVEGWPKPKRV